MWNYDRPELRCFGFIRVVGRILNFLFVDTLLAGYFFADDGTCEAIISSESRCLSLRSIDGLEHLCVWSGGSCVFNQNIGSTLTSTMLLTVIISVCAVPFDFLVDLMITQVKPLIHDLVRRSSNDFPPVSPQSPLGS